MLGEYKLDYKYEDMLSPLEPDTEDRNDDLDVQDFDDAEAAGDLGEEASNDLPDEVVDETENSAEEGADEAPDLREETADLNLDGDANNSKHRRASTEDEL